MPDDSTKPATSAAAVSVLTSLRALLPERRLFLSEALQLAERQAQRLLQLRHVNEAPVPAAVVTGLPRITLRPDPDLPRHAASGMSNWDCHQRCWIISVNPDEPATRQRFTVIHEYKHIIDHGHAGLGGHLPNSIYRLTPPEYIAEYFAGCVLMPKRWVKTAFYGGLQRTAELADYFDVSERAIEVRLMQLGITGFDSPAADPAPRYRLQLPARSSRVYDPLAGTRHSATFEKAAA